MEGSYTHPDGSSDSKKDLTTTVRCFAVALHNILKPSEGIVVELAFQEKRPDDPYGKFGVWNDGENGYIAIFKIDPDDELFKAKNGQMIWMHNNEKEANTMEALEKTLSGEK